MDFPRALAPLQTYLRSSNADLSQVVQRRLHPWDTAGVGLIEMNPRKAACVPTDFAAHAVYGTLTVITY